MLKKHAFISVVTPVYNEELILEEYIARTVKVLDTFPGSEIIFINDGSTDGSLFLLKQAAHKDSRIKILDFSRNFGHQIALSAGIDHAFGEVVVTMDSDLQDPPELITEMIGQWKMGFKVVFAVRSFRKSDGFFKKISASIFYRVFNYLGGVAIPFNAGDFRLLDQEVVRYLRAMPERNRFLRGMVPWLGFSKSEVYFERPPRFGGKTKYSFFSMLALAVDGIVAFSPNLLRFSAILGLVAMFLSVVFTGYVFSSHYFFHQTIQGWSSLMVAILFFGGAQLLVVGVLGEYLGRVYEEVKHRPLYVVREKIWPREHGH